MIKRQATEIKELYEIENTNGKRVIKVRSNEYNLGQVREWLQNCLNATECEGDFSIRKVLQNSSLKPYLKVNPIHKEENAQSSSSSSRKTMKTFLPSQEYKQFIGRSGDFTKIHKNPRVIISAVSGTGKTTLAREFAEINKKDYKNVQWILSDTGDKVKEKYFEILKEINNNAHGLIKQKQLIQSVHDYIDERRDEKFLFVFDNVEQIDDIKPYIDDLLNCENVKVIITTKKSLDDFSLLRQFEPIKLSEFNEDEAIKFLQANMNGRISEENLRNLVEIIGRVPYRLNRFIKLRHDDEYKFEKLDTFVDIYKKKFLDSKLMFTNWISSDKLEEKRMWQILLLVSRIEPDFCDVDIITETLSIKKSELSALINELERQNFIKQEFNENESGVKIIRMIQDEVTKHIAQHNNAENSANVIDLADLDSKLMQTLNSLFESTLKEENLKKAELLYPHV